LEKVRFTHDLAAKFSQPVLGSGKTSPNYHQVFHVVTVEEKQINVNPEIYEVEGCDCHPGL